MKRDNDGNTVEQLLNSVLECFAPRPPSIWKFLSRNASSEFVPRGIFITGESFFAKEFLKVFSFHRSHFSGEFLSHLKQERMLKVEKVNHLLVN